MRLCVATPLYPPDSGGPATYARALERGLPGLGDSVDVIKFGDVRHLPKGIRHFRYFLRLLHRAASMDAILALDPVSVGVPAALAAFLLRKPFIVKIVGDYAWEQGVQRGGISESLDEFVALRRVAPLATLLRKVQYTVARSARTIIVPSEYLKKIVMSWGIDPARIQVIYNAVQVDLEKIGTYELPPHTIVTAGRLVPWKGIRGLLDAFVRVRAEVSDARLIIIGDGPERESLEAYAKERGVEEVHFFGARTRLETLGYLRVANAFVLNSTYEGLSHVLIEALMLGTPVIATDAGGNPELIRDGENGLLIAVGDTDSLAEALIHVLTDERVRTHLIRGTADTSERFSLEAMLEETHVCLARAAYAP